GPRRQSGAEKRAVDQPVGLWVAPDHRGPEQRGGGVAHGELRVRCGMASGVRLRGDHCDRDWIWDRQLETAPPAEIRARAEAAWESQSRRLLEVSPFYARKLAAAGADSTPPTLA